MTGYITYIEYGAGLSKGETNAMGMDEDGNTTGDVFNTPFKLGKVDANYTSAKVVETIAAEQTELAFTPIEGSVEKFTGGKWVAVEGKYSPAEGDKVRYHYDNVVIPQGVDKIPTIKAQMKSIALLAKARRIAVYYSQIAAFQAKTDYGFDLGDQLAEKAVGQLSYEIDTEIVKLLDETAGEGATKVYADRDDVTLEWTRAHATGVSKAEHYEGFAEVIEVGRQIIYDRTQRFAPNYMIIASDVLPILTFMKGFQAAPTGTINGPYFAGTLNGMKVFVSPAIKAGRFLLGVNGDDMMSSVAVYAPYMAIVPTQLLQYADGGTSQGWSTMYDLKVLNKDLIVAGQVTGALFALDK